MYVLVAAYINNRYKPNSSRKVDYYDYQPLGLVRYPPIARHDALAPGGVVVNASVRLEDKS